jgi:uncharacterized protein YutE (UPF0331/DUF86 family)
VIRIEVVREKIRRLRETRDALHRCLPREPEALRDRDRRDLVAFRVYVAMQEAIDLAAHLVAEEGWGPAPDLRAHFSILRDHGVLEEQLAEHLAAGVKVHNVIAHAYVEIDPVKLHAAAGELGALVEPFCAAVLAFAEGRAR